MEKDFYYAELFELYKGLFTERQREIFSSHYSFDLSLGEIAESAGITRQSVLDTLKKVKEKLDFYERELGLKKLYDGIYKITEETDQNTSAKLKDLIGI